MTRDDPIAHAIAVLHHAEAHDCTCATIRTDVLRRLIDAYALWTTTPRSGTMRP